MRLAIATFTGRPAEFGDEELLLARLAERGVEAALVPWDEPGFDWEGCDLVVARSPWDYAQRLDEFLAWVDRVGARLENAPAVIRWNSDKHYLGDLRSAGVATVDTVYVEPGRDVPPIEGEVVIKPTVSGGARDTGRFGPAHALAGLELIERIHAGGRTAMIQPYVATVEGEGETAAVMIDGELSHVLRKRALLAPDEVAPVRDDELGIAEVMYDPGLVVAGSAREDEVELAGAVIAAVRERFGVTPLIARVDMLRGVDGGPVVLELEAIEPNLYFDRAPGADARLAEAILARGERRAREGEDDRAKESR
jgi:glutathione synthase/RimK-type ligase-like ATP-grasp enzyme